MISINSNGDRLFQGRIYRDNPTVQRLISQLADDTVECLGAALDKIERSQLSILPFLYPRWYIAEDCGFWIHFSVEPGEEWGDVVLLKEVS
jgi:hypothetical protein